MVVNISGVRHPVMSVGDRFALGYIALAPG
jgi:hypothetical protein